MNCILLKCGKYCPLTFSYSPHPKIIIKQFNCTTSSYNKPCVSWIGFWNYVVLSVCIFLHLSIHGELYSLYLYAIILGNTHFWKFGVILPASSNENAHTTPTRLRYFTVLYLYFCVYGLWFYVSLYCFSFYQDVWSTCVYPWFVLGFVVIDLYFSM